MKRHTVEVRKKGENYFEPGELIKTIKRVLRAEAIGNFNPVFCQYEKKNALSDQKRVICLIHSEELTAI